MRIYYKLIIVLVAFILVSTMFVSYMVYYNSKNILEREILSKLNIIADQETDEVEAYFSEKKFSMEALEHSDQFKTAFMELNRYSMDVSTPSYVEAKKRVDQLLAVLQGAYKYVDIVLASKEGKIVYVFNPEHEAELGTDVFDKNHAPRKTGAAAYNCEVIKTTHKEHPYVLYLTSPLYDAAGEAAGLMRLEIDMSAIYEFTQDNPGLGHSWETLLVKRAPDNKVMYISPLKYEQGAILTKTVAIRAKDALASQNAILGESGSGLSIDYRGKIVLSAWRPIQSLEWGLVAKIDQEEAFLPVYRLRKLLIIVMLVTIFSALLTAFAITKSISDPIDKLRKGVEIIGLGNLYHRVVIDSRDEIGQLSRAFNKMTENLKRTTTSIDRLNSEVAERGKILKWQQDVDQLQQRLLGPAAFEEKIRSITDGIVRVFNVDFCRIWLTRPGDRCERGCVHASAENGSHVCRHRDNCLHLVASSGRYTHIDGKSHARIPFGRYKIGIIASGSKHKFLTNDVINDPGVHDREWAREFGLVSFAGYQLRVEKGEPIGVLALFAKHPISDAEDAILDGLSVSAAFVAQKNAVDSVLEKQSRALRASLEETSKSREILASMLEDNNLVRENLETMLRDLKQSQDMLVQFEKLASLGKLVADMAHEVNNPLMIISGNAQLSLLDGSINEELKNNLMIIHGECNRAKSIIQRLLTFSRPAKGERKAVDINRSIGSVINLIEHQFGLTDVKIVYRPAECLPLIVVDETQIQEVIMNLLNNARDAIVGKGEITIKTYVADEHLMIEIKDSGAGMDNKTLARIFEPFFSTKEKGTGLGLSVCYGIIKDHKGKLEFKSQPPNGTTAYISLPIKTEGAR
jgi:signal transduction histidine kinase